MSISPYFSYFLVFISHTIFMTGFIYANQNSLNPIQTNFLRGMSTILLNFCLLKYFNMSMQYKLRQNHKYLLIRSSSICLHSIILAWSGFYLPQPVIHTIVSCGPMFVMIQDYFINSIMISKSQFKGIVLTFIGILLTINGDYLLQNYYTKPTSLMGQIQQIQSIQQQLQNNKFNNYATDNPTIKLGVALILTSIMTIWAYGTIVVKQMININSIQINLYFGVFLTLFCGLLYPVFVIDKQPLDTMFYGLFLCGMPMAVGNIIYIYALTINKNTGLNTLCISASVFVAYFISVFRYNEDVNVICLIGTICIISGLAVALVIGKQKQNIQDKQQKLVQSDQQNKFQLTQIERISINAK